MITLVGNNHNGSSHIVELSGVTDMPTHLSGIAILESATHPELRRLADKYELDYGNLSDALDINETPRLEHRDNYDYLYLRLPSPNSRDITQITRPVLAVYNSKVLFIITGAKSLASNGDQMLADLATIPTIIDALVYVLARIIDSFDQQIKKQTDAIRNIVVRLQRGRLQSETTTSFILIEDQINTFASALTPLVPLLNRLQADRSLRLSTATNDMLTDVILATQQSISICDANAKRITSINNAYTAMSSDSLNRVMKTLTIATLLIAVPNLVFSMYGMNIRLPMQYTDATFALVMILALVIVILFIIWGKKRRLF